MMLLHLYYCTKNTSCLHHVLRDYVTIAIFLEPESFCSYQKRICHVSVMSNYCITVLFHNITAPGHKKIQSSACPDKTKSMQDEQKFQEALNVTFLFLPSLAKAGWMTTWKILMPRVQTLKPLCQSLEQNKVLTMLCLNIKYIIFLNLYRTSVVFLIPQLSKVSKTG